MLNLPDAVRIIQNLMRELLRSDLQLVEYCQYVMDQTQQALDFDIGWLLLREGDWLKVVAADRHHAGDVGRSLPVADSVCGYCALQRAPVNIPNLADMPEALRRIYKSLSEKTMRSELALPLLVGEHAIGVLNLESCRENAFDAHDQEFLTLLVSYVAIAVTLARSRQEAAALGRIGLDLARQTEMDTVVRSVLAHALTLVQGQFGQVLLREGDRLVVRYTTNQPPADLNLAVDIHDSVSGLALLELRPVIVPDVTRCDYLVVELGQQPAAGVAELLPRTTDRPRYKRALEANKASIAAEFALPIHAQGQVIGVLNVETPRPDGFSSEQRQALLAFVDAQAERLAEALLGSHTEVLNELLRQALRCVDSAFGQLLSCSGNDLIIEQTTGGERIGTRVPLSRSVTGRAVQTGAPVYVPDVSQDPDYQRYLGEEMKSELVVPMLLGEQAIGVLNIESPIPGFFTGEHARILEALASQAAVAIDRTRKFESQKLAELGSLAGDIVHRLNNPLGAISMRLELLQRKDFYADMCGSYPYLDQVIQQVQAELNTAKATIRELRSALMPEGTRLRPMALRPAIAEALSKANLPDTVQIGLSVPDETPQVWANDRLVNVFWNLFDNARKAMPQGGRLTISAAGEPADDWVWIRVQDTGPGIPAWRLDLIFEPDEATLYDSYAPARGLGLWWTKAHVESFGGSIAVESQEGLGTCVTLRLRRAR